MTELFGSKSCPFTGEMREWLEFNGREFVEYDVDEDSAALKRMEDLTDGQRIVPVLVEHGRVVQVGWQGRGCIAGARSS